MQARGRISFRQFAYLFFRVTVFAVPVTVWAMVWAMVGSLAFAQSTSPVRERDAKPSARAQGVAGYGRIPLSFEANRGQTDPSVQFLSHGAGHTLLLREGEAVLALRGGEPLAANISDSAGAGSQSEHAANKALAGGETSVVSMHLLGANGHSAFREEERQITRTNYFIGNDPSRWRTDIPNYGRVRYAGVYPGIDLVYYGNQGHLEHDFVVAPGADPSRIRLSLDGAKSLRIDPVTGDLVVTTGSDLVPSELRLLKPVTYQESGGKRTPLFVELRASRRKPYRISGGTI